MATDLLRKSQPSHLEFGFLLTIVAILTGLLIFTDISIHESYIKQIIATCYPENQENFCMIIRAFLGLSETAQLEIGGTYWAVLSIQAVTLAGVMGLLRLMVAKLAGEEFNAMVIFVALMWAFTTYAFFLFGYLDYGYYIFQGLGVPPVLDWLDGVGLFVFVQGFGATESVDDTDLYLLMGIGGGIVLGIWATITHHYRVGTLKKLGLD